MRRALLAITGLAASTTVLVVLKGSPGASQVAQDLPADLPAVVPGSADPTATGDAVTADPSPTDAAASPRPTRS
ncbi:FMN-binding protein, partial [Micromonospora sp. NPDC049799]